MRVLVVGWILLIAGAASVSAQRDGVFEGRVVYTVETRSNDPIGQYRDFAERRHGDTLEVWFAANGDFKYLYRNAGWHGFESLVYNQESNQTFLKTNYSDTLFVSNAAENPLQLNVFARGGTSVILGQNCPSVFFSARHPISGVEISETVYFFPELKTNPEFYRDYHDMFWNRMVTELGGIWLRRETNYGGYTVTYAAIEVIPGKPEPSQFQIDAALPQKNIEAVFGF